MKTPALPGSQLDADHPYNGGLIPRRYTVNGHDFVVIVENLADLPVLEAEIAVLETYLGDIVDEILAEIERESVAAQRFVGRKAECQEEGDEPKDRRREQRR